MKIVFISGTTASGKSRLAMELAQNYGGRIVNCDSIQCYEGLDIGSAKPSASDIKLCPHDLYSWVKVGQQATVGDYFRKFEELKKQYPREILWVVGGTGFYFQSLEFGLYQAPPVDQKLVAQLENEVKTFEGNQTLFNELKTRDPVTAERISANDHYRLVRAVEMMRTTGLRVSEVKAKLTGNPIIDVFKVCILPSKASLTSAIVARIEKMLAQGLIAETEGILKQTDKSWRPLQSVGYFEVLKYLSGEVKKEELPSLIATSTLQLAKKQRTWFKRDQKSNFLESSNLKDFHAQCGQGLERFLHRDRKIL